MEYLKEIHFINSYTGLFHTLIAIAAMLFGTLVFLNKKGTRKHKRLGYIYFVCMLLVNGSAFGIYNMGGFSVFHFLALVSLITTCMGLAAPLRRKENWLVSHFYWMNWSVVGLYCAFWAETIPRLFDMQYFWWMVAIASGVTAAIGARLINREAKKMFGGKA